MRAVAPRPAAPPFPAAALPGTELLQGRPFSAILAEDDGARAALLDATVRAVADSGTPLVRTSGPLRVPLSLERLLIQAARNAGEILSDTDAALVVRELRERRGDRTHLVLVVEHADALAPDVLAALGRVALESAAQGLALQILFVGRPAFRTLLDAEGMAPIRDSFAPRQEAVEDAPPRPAPPAPETDPPAAPWTGRPRLLGGLLTFAVVAAGIVLGMQHLGMQHLGTQHVSTQHGGDRPPGPPPAAPVVVPAPTRSAPAAPEAAGTAAPPPAESPPAAVPPPSDEDETARLQREFDAFLSASGPRTARLSDAQRRALFDEFLGWRSRAGAGEAGAASAGPRVVVHYPADSADAEALARRLAAALGPRADVLRVSKVVATPNTPMIRFFFPEDAATAQDLAGALAGSGLPWTVQDATRRRPREASRGVLEVLVPAR